MTVKLALPRAAGTRDMVNVVLDEQHVPANLRGQTVVVNGGDVQDASSSFADELVRILAARHVGKIVLVGLPPSLAGHMEQAAALRHFSGIKKQVSS